MIFTTSCLPKCVGGKEVPLGIAKVTKFHLEISMLIINTETDKQQMLHISFNIVQQSKGEIKLIIQLNIQFRYLIQFNSIK